MNLNNIKEISKWILNGIIMGIVETIPGVSGSTIAIVSGIYERLINSIQSFDLKLLKYLRNLEFKKSWKYIDGSFLITILISMFIGIIVSIFTITKLLETSPQKLWGFFFGLVLASGLFLFNKYFLHNKKKEDLNIKNDKNIKEKKFISNEDLFSKKRKNINLKFKKESSNLHNFKFPDIFLKLFFFITGILLTAIIILSTPATGSSSLPIIFLSGMLAIIAFMLPGISGSFVLLLLGMYSIIIPALKETILTFNIEASLITITFIFGIIFGILSFSKILSYILRKWKDKLMAFLIGIIFSSLIKLWPWKIPETILLQDGEIINISKPIDEYTNYKVLLEHNFIPEYTQETSQIIILAILGAISILFFTLFQKKA